MLIVTPATLFRAALALTTLAGATLAPAQAQLSPPSWLNAYAPGYAPTASSSLATDAAGNTYATGSFTGSITLGTTTLTSQGLSDGYLVKYTPTGTVAWIFTLSTPTNEMASDVALDAAGNVYVTGSFTSSIPLHSNGMQLTSSTTASKAFVVRVSPQGVPEWVQQSSASASTSANGYSVDVDAAGNVYACGLYSSSVSFGAPAVVATSRTGFGAYLLRLRATTGDAFGAVAAFDYQPAQPPVTYQIPRVAAGSGSVFIATSFAVPIEVNGTTYTTRGNNDVLLLKYNALGGAEWVRQEGGPNEDRLTDAEVDADNNLYLTGTLNGTSTFGPTTLPGAGGLDGYLAKYSPLGTLLWIQGHGGPGSDGWGSVSLDAGGAPYVAGHFSTGAQFGTRTLTAVGSNDIVVASYTPQGQLNWVQQAGGPGSDVGFHVGIRAPYLYVFGTYVGSCTFDTQTISSSNTTTANFLARLGDPTLATHSVRPEPLSFYPNPATSVVSVPGLPAGCPVQLVDALGRVARETSVSAEAQVSVRGLPPGLYLLRATDSQGRPVAGRLLVE